VNYYSFALHDTTAQSITDLFWKQMAWIQPESFISDGGTYLTFVSRNQDLFTAVHKALMSSPVTG